MKRFFLVDAFGVLHSIVVEPPLAPLALIGRAAGEDLSLAESTVSLRHASLEHRARSGAWFVVDERSENGTFVNSERVIGRFPLEHGDLIFFGRRVGFRVLLPSSDDARGALWSQLCHQRANKARVQTRVDGEPDPRAVYLRAATEGGAVAALGDDVVQLSELEYELLAVLKQRFDDDNAHEDVRGFVPADQLLEVLSFHADVPVHNNLRVLVRKLRKKFAALHPPHDIVASKKGLGYRAACQIFAE